FTLMTSLVQFLTALHFSTTLCRFCIIFSFLIIRLPPIPTLFPYTTLFRSRPHRERLGERLEEGGAQVGTPLRQPPRQLEAAGEERAVAPWEGTATAEGGLQVLGRRPHLPRARLPARQERIGLGRLEEAYLLDVGEGARVRGGRQALGQHGDVHRAPRPAVLGEPVLLRRAQVPVRVRVAGEQALLERRVLDARGRAPALGERAHGAQLADQVPVDGPARERGPAVPARDGEREAILRPA